MVYLIVWFNSKCCCVFPLSMLESHQQKISVIAMQSRALVCRIETICILEQLDFPLA